MKKWQKVLLIILIVLAVIGGVAFGVYEYYVKPKVIEPTLEKVSEILKDDDLKKEIDQFVQEMVDSGILNDSDVQGYIENRERQNAEKEASAASGEPSDGTAASGTSAQSSNGSTGNTGTAAPSNNGTTQAGGSANGGNVGSASSGASGGGTNNASENKPKVDENSSFYDRVKAAMTADEFSFAMSVYGKLNVSYVVNNMNSDRAAVKEYVQSTLSSSEMSRCLDLYSKYSYLMG